VSTASFLTHGGALLYGLTGRDAGLSAVANIVRAQPTAVPPSQCNATNRPGEKRKASAARELENVSVALANTLLHLQDSFHTRGFLVKRHAGLTALIERDPYRVAPFLANQFYAPNYDIRVRLDILDVLVAGARCLALMRRGGRDTPPRRNILGTCGVVVRKSKSARKNARSSAANCFRHFSSAFIAPFVVQKTVCPPTLDPVLLARLVGALGIFSELAWAEPASHRLFRVLLETVLWPVRGHRDVGVRRAVLHTFFRLFASLSRVRLREVCEEMFGGARGDTLGAWLWAVQEEDTDAECRVVSSHLLRVCKRCADA